MLVHVTVLIRILSTSDLIDAILAANDIVNLQRLELRPYLIIRCDTPLSLQQFHHEAGRVF